MSSQDIGLRIRSQSSYEFSLANSRESKLFSSESLVLDDTQLSRGRYVQMFNINKKLFESKTSMQRLLQPLRKGANPNSKTEYIVMHEYEQNHHENNVNKILKKRYRNNNQEEDKAQQKKQLSNTLAFYPNYYHKHQTILSSVPLPTLNLINSYKRCSLTPQNDLIDRAYGAMFGFIIGDSVGSYLIHQNITEISDVCTALEMKNGGRFGLSPGQGTDQTQLCLTVSQGLLQSFQYGGDYDKNIIARKYFQWIESQPFDFPTLVAISFSEIRKEQRLHSQKMNDNLFLGQSLIRGSLRNINHQSLLSLIRVIPIVLISIHNHRDRLIWLIKQQMKFFTPNKFATQVAIIYGLLLRQTILTNDHQFAINQASKWAYTYGSDNLIQLWTLFQQGKQITINSMNMNNVSVPLLFALNAINKKQISFIETIFKTLIKGYNTDTNCSIVMGLVGAVIGLNKMPNFYKNKVIDCQVQNSKRKRNKMYGPSTIVDLVPKLINCSVEFQRSRNTL